MNKQLLRKLAIIFGVGSITLSTAFTASGLYKRLPIPQNETVLVSTKQCDEQVPLVNKATKYTNNNFNINVRIKQFAHCFFNSSIPAYLNKDKTIYFLNLIMNYKDFFFKNFPPDLGPQHIDIKAINVDAMRGMATFDMCIKYGYREDGSLGEISLPYKTVCLTGLKTVVPTEISVGDVLPNNVLPSNFTAQGIKPYLKINSRKTLIWKKGVTLGCNDLYELIDPFGMTYDASGNEIFLPDGDTFLTEVITQVSKNGWRKLYKANIDIYTVLGDYDYLSIIIVNANDAIGELNCWVDVPNSITPNGSLGECSRRLYFGDLRYKDTHVVNHTLQDNEFILPKDKSEYDLISEILRNGLIRNAKYTIACHDIEISNRVNDNVLGNIKCTVTIKNGQAYRDRETVDSVSFDDVYLFGFKQVKATTYRWNMIVDWASKFSTVVADHNVSDELILEYIDQTRAIDFIKHLVPEATSENFKILNRLDDPINGNIQFKLSLDLYYDKDTGEYITPYENKPYVSGIFTVNGFKTKGLTTTIDLKGEHVVDNVGHLLANEFAHKEHLLKNEVLFFLKKYLKDLAHGANPERLTLANISYKVLEGSIDNTKGKFKLKIFILNGLAWENGLPIQTFSFNSRSFVFSGFKIQKQTKPKKFAIKLGERDNNNINQFGKREAEVFVNRNLDLIFDDLPPNQMVKVVNIKYRPIFGNASVTFALDYYYDHRGFLSKEKDKSVFHVLAEGFYTANTVLTSKWIHIDGLSETYSIENWIIDADWVKSKFTNEMFLNLPPNYDLEKHLYISNVRNTWMDSKVPFGSIHFDLCLTDLHRATSKDGSLKIKNVVFSGFKTTDATTSLRHDVIYSAAQTSAISPSAIRDSLIVYKLRLKFILSDINEISPLFNNTIPGSKLSKSDITIDGVKSINNRVGSITLQAELNNIAWDRGIKKPFQFEITILGFKTQAPTIWSNNTLVNSGLFMDKVENWTPADAWNFVKIRSKDFFTSVPKYEDEVFDNFDVNILGYSKEKASATIEVILKKYYNQDGLETELPYLTKQFNIMGFREQEKGVTRQVHNELSSLFSQRKILPKMSRFTDDILGPNKKQYQKEILKFLRRFENAFYVLQDYNIDKHMSYPRDLKISPNIFSPFSSVVASIWYDDCALGRDNYGSRCFDYILYNTFPTPFIDLNIAPQLTHNAIEALTKKYPQWDDFRTHFTWAIYESIRKFVFHNDGAFFPDVIKKTFDDKNQAVVLNAIAKGVCLNYNANKNSDIVKHVFFSPYNLASLPQLKKTTFGKRISSVSYSANATKTNVVEMNLCGERQIVYEYDWSGHQRLARACDRIFIVFAIIGISAFFSMLIYKLHEHLHPIVM